MSLLFTDGLGGKATSTVIFLIGPLMLTNTARLAEEEAAQLEMDEEEPGVFHLPHLLPTSVPSIAIAVALFLQCIAAPLLALYADRYGMRRTLLAVHVFLGLICNVLLGVSGDWSVAVRSALLAGLYYSMALAWMFQNSLLPSVASSARRPMVSLLSAGLSNVGVR